MQATPDQSRSEIIAVLLPDGTPSTPAALQDFVATGTMLLVRHADGRMALEPARRESAWRGASVPDCVYKSRPIRDPDSREVIGYELETISPALMC